MKRMIRAISAALTGVMVLLCAACGTEAQNVQSSQQDVTEESEKSYISEYETIVPVENQPVTEMTVNSAANEAPVSTEVPEESVSYSFRSAVWLAKDTAADTERYFLFYDDHNGRYLEQENGMGLGFTCELSMTKGVFRFGDAEIGRTAELRWLDADTVSFQWDDGKIETLTYLRDNGAEDLQFYSNEALCQMALDHYEAANGYRPSMAGATINLDEMIAIQLYDLVGDHISTSDWYTVDRYTAKGYNVINEPIALAAPAAAETVPGETAPAAESTPVTESVPVTETVPGETTASETTPVV